MAALDLKNLERSLDEALEKETTESLNEFLNSQKHQELFKFLGNGTIESLTTEEWVINFQKGCFEFPAIESEPSPDENSYAQAA